MFALSGTGPYTCVNCGNNNNDYVYKTYGRERSFSGQKSTPTHFKLAECQQCSQEVDNYVELDSCILLLDAFLQKTRFYRHILMNCAVSVKKIPLKLGIIFMLCEAYYKWSHFYTNQIERNYVALEHSFYFMLALTAVFNLMLYVVVIAVSRCVQPGVGFLDLLSCFVICSYGKLFYVPAALWAAELSPAIDVLLELIYLFSLAQCLRVKVQVCSIGRAVALIALAKCAQLGLVSGVFWLLLQME